MGSLAAAWALWRAFRDRRETRYRRLLELRAERAAVRRALSDPDDIRAVQLRWLRAREAWLDAQLSLAQHVRAAGRVRVG